MKKEIKGFIAGALSVSLLSAGVSYAAGWLENISVVKNSTTISANYQPVNADNFIYNDTTYVPLRALTESLGCVVMWNEETRDISVNNAPLYLAKFATASMMLISAADGTNGEIKSIYDGLEQLYKDSQFGLLSENSLYEIENKIQIEQHFVDMYQEHYDTKENNAMKYFAENNLLDSIDSDTMTDIYDNMSKQLMELDCALKSLRVINSCDIQIRDKEYAVALHDGLFQNYMDSISKRHSELFDKINDVDFALYYYIQDL